MKSILENWTQRLAKTGWVLTLAMIYGCASQQYPAPVSERSVQYAQPSGKPLREIDTTSNYYTVKPGDTLYSIALDHGLDYHDLATWNGILNPNALSAGQQLHLRPPPAPAVATATTAPFVSAPPVRGEAVGSAAVANPEVPAEGNVKTQPQAVKMPYSAQAYASLSPSQIPVQKVPVGDDSIVWGWPAMGDVINAFNEASNMKGIDIAGKMGQAVLASAAGTVLYSGSGIRGYGKLIVIKHNGTYSSVYAHNSVILVKEGETVIKGQKIAEMGDSDADRVELHFEIRRVGKPVDPAKLLPAQ